MVSEFQGTSKGSFAVTTNRHNHLTAVFDLPEHLAAKAEPALIAADQRHLTAVKYAVERQTAQATEQLGVLKKQPRGVGDTLWNATRIFTG